MTPRVVSFQPCMTAVVAPGQTSREDTVTVALQDSSGPFDYHLTRRLLALCRRTDIPHRRDVFDHYRSDAAESEGSV